MAPTRQPSTAAIVQSSKAPAATSHEENAQAAPQDEDDIDFIPEDDEEEEGAQEVLLLNMQPRCSLKAVCSSAKSCSGQWQAWWLSGGGVVGLNTSCRP